MKFEIGQIVKSTRKDKSFGAIGKVVTIDEDGDAICWFEDRLFGFQAWSEDHYKWMENAGIEEDAFGCFAMVFQDQSEVVE